MKHEKSFSLIEILVVITIIFVLTGMSIAAYNKFNQYQKLDNATKKLEDIFELNRKKAISSDLGQFNFSTCADFRGYHVVVGGNNISFALNCGGAFNWFPIINMEANMSFPNCGGSCIIDYKPLTAEVTLSGGAGFVAARYIRIQNNALGANECNTLSISTSGIVTITNKTICTP